MIYNILIVTLAILMLPSSVYLFLIFKGVIEAWIRLFLMLMIIVFIGTLFPYINLELGSFILFYLFCLGLFGWVFFPVIENTKMFKDYKLKSEK